MNTDHQINNVVHTSYVCVGCGERVSLPPMETSLDDFPLRFEIETEPLMVSIRDPASFLKYAYEGEETKIRLTCQHCGGTAEYLNPYLAIA